MRSVQAFLGIMAAFLLAACGNSDRSESNSSGGRQSGSGENIVRVNLGGEPSTLDPNQSYGVPEHRVLMNVFEPLVRLGADLTPVAAAAESWEHSDDYRTWTFRLRSDAVWTNGDPVTADDFIFAVRRIITPSTAAEYALMVYSFLEGGEEFYRGGGKDPSLLGLSAPDDHTLVIKLKNPTPYFLSLANHTSWYPLHRRTVEEHGDGWWEKPDTLISNGAYKLVEFRPKDRIVLEQSVTYWNRENVHLKGAVFRFIENEPTEIAAYESGDIDITNSLPNREAEQLLKRSDAFVGPKLAIYYVSFNVTRPPFDDPALRKAAALVVDRDLIVERITGRGERPASGFVPRGMVLSSGEDYRDVAGPVVDQRPLEERIPAAKRILAEAGYGSRKPLPRTSYLFNTMEAHSDIAEVLQSVWKTHLDLDVRLENTEWGVYLERKKKHDFDIKRGGWVGDYLDPLTFLDTFEPGSDLNSSGYANPRFKFLLDKARAEVDPDKRIGYLVQAERLLVEEDTIVVPLYDYVEAVMMRDGLEGVVMSPLSGVDLTHARWVR